MSSGPAIDERISPPKRHRVWSPPFGVWRYAIFRWSEIPEVSAEQIRTVLQTVKDADRLYVPLSETLKSEYLWADRSLNAPCWWGAIDFKRRWRTSIADSILSADSESSPIPFVVRGFFWTVGEPLKTQRLLRHALANQLQEIDKPLPVRRPAIEAGAALLFSRDATDSRESNQLIAEEIDRETGNSLVLEMFLPHSKNLHEFFLRDRVQESMLEIVLAAQTYVREHGEFPEDPQSLVPSYLDKWPLDAWDQAGQSIRYRREAANSAVVWSVGGNGIDDAGEIGSDNFGFSTPDCGIRIKAR